MKSFFLILVALSTVCLRADENSSASNASGLPKEIELQEQYVLLSAKVKTLAEVQDLILKQQQLILQNLDALRKEVEQVKLDRTNAAGPQRPAGNPQDLSAAAAAQKPATEMVTKGTDTKPTVQTNAFRGYRFETYKVQPGDTLSKILIRANDTMDKNNLPRLTQDQLEKANPGVNPDKIRVGQTILIPLSDKP